MFGERNMIDESCSRMIDETDRHIVDDIKDAKRRGVSSADHLCEEGHSHESTDRQMSAAYNTTPRTRPYPQPGARTAPPARSSAPYPKPAMQQYTPAAARREERPVQTTVVNGRSFDRPAEPVKPAAAQSKALLAFIILIAVGFMGSCFGIAMLLPLCVVFGILTLNAAKKSEPDDTSKVYRVIAIAVIAVIAVVALNIAGRNLFSALNELSKELGGY